MKQAFYAVGAVFEFIGIVTIAAPDFFPYALRLGAWSRRRILAVIDLLRRLIGKPRHQVIQVGGIASAATVGGASLIKSVNPAATLEERVEFLLARDQEAQRDMNDLQARVGGMERESPERLDTLRAELQSHVASEIAEADADYRAARVWGAVALAIGLGLSTAGNFIG